MVKTMRVFVNGKKRLNGKLISPIVIIILAFSIIGDYVQGGVYVLRGAILLLICLYFSFYNQKLIIKRDLFIGSMILMSLYSFCSRHWSYNPGQSTAMGMHMFGITFVLFIIYTFYNNGNFIHEMLRIVMWTGYVVSIFVIIKFGYDKVILLLLNSERMTSEYVNSNTLGMNTAFSVLISVYFMLYDRLKYEYLLSMLALIITIVSGSRKAFIIITFGIFLLLLLRRKEMREKRQKQIMQYVLVIIGIVFAIMLLNRINAFDLLISRMEQIMLFYKGINISFHSLSDRTNLVDLGLRCFRAYPILGVGADCIGLICGPYFGYNYYYTHNNYIELLANGGIIGFLIYYYIYIYIIYNMLKYRDFRNKEYVICFVLLILRLCLDYAYVSYDSRSTYFFISILFLETEKLKQKNKVKILRKCTPQKI